MPFPEGKGHELASCFNCEAELVVRSGRRSRKRNRSRDILDSLYARCALATIA
jgi:hypothetical protein